VDEERGLNARTDAAPGRALGGGGTGFIHACPGVMKSLRSVNVCHMDGEFVIFDYIEVRFGTPTRAPENAISCKFTPKSRLRRVKFWYVDLRGLLTVYNNFVVR
jgi:hypothetical protein